MKVLKPKGWKKPKGYSNGIAAEGRYIFVAGQIGWDKRNKFVSEKLVPQVRQALKNVVAVLREGGAKACHIVRMTWYVTDKRDYLLSAKDIGSVYREVIGEHYPAMSLIPVNELLENDAKVEIEVTAVIPTDDNE